MRRDEFDLYHDAIRGRSTELLSKVFDRVRVEVSLERHGYAIQVQAGCVHRGTFYWRAAVFDVQMLNPYDYGNYLRDRLPAEFAREIIDYIIRS